MQLLMRSSDYTDLDIILFCSDIQTPRSWDETIILIKVVSTPLTFGCKAPYSGL